MNEDKLCDGTMRRNPNKYELQGGKWAVLPGKDRHPDYTGKIKIATANGELAAYVSAWVRKGQDGTPFLSFTAEYPRQENRRLAIQGAATSPAPITPATVIVGEDEDLPF
jgi:hypothetical protein